MKIKLAILERDTGYLNRFVSVFSTKYADKFEIYSFTDKTVAIPALADSKIDVLVASDVFEIDASKLPRRCGFAYFVDSTDIDTVNDQRTICRFQRADLIYKQILSIYSEHAGTYTGLKLHDSNCKLFAFASPSGGVGSSTLAAACAMHFAAGGRKTLYLNLEKFGSSNDFFSGEGQFDMGDLIYTLKSRKANLAMKLESCVRQDRSGVFYFAPTKLALDMMELTAEEIQRMLAEIKLTGSYEYIILDTDFSLEQSQLEVWHQINALVLVGDGSRISNTKMARACEALGVKEEAEDLPLLERTVLAYNKFSSKTGKTIENLDLKTIGGAPRYEHAAVEQILAQLSRMTMFEEIEK